MLLLNWALRAKITLLVPTTSHESSRSLLRNRGEEDEEEEEGGPVAVEGREGGDLQEEVFQDQHRQRGQQGDGEGGGSEELRHAARQKVKFFAKYYIYIIKI